MKTEPRMRSGLAVSLLALLVLTCTEGNAIPTFARKYKTSCSTCHYAFPKLNAFGQAFQANGFRYPAATDREVTKEEPVSLGSEGQKRAFPDAIWPADIAGTSPVSLHLTSQMHLNKKDPKLSFEFPHELGLMAAGTVGETFSYFAEVGIEQANELSYGFFVQYDNRPQFHIRVGGIEPMPIQDGLRLTAASYNIGDFHTVADEKSGGNPIWSFGGDQSGIEVWGRTNGPNGRGGFRYALGVANGQSDDSNNAIKTAKDFFVYASYKFGGLGEIGGTKGAESRASAFWLDNSVRVGGYSYVGKSRYGGFDNKFYVVGENWDVWYNRLNLFGSYLYQKDKNVDGADQRVVTKAWFTQGDVVIYPWLIGIGRYEWTRVGADAKASMTFIPGIAVVLRANLKLTPQGLIPLNDRDNRDWEYIVQLTMGI